MNNNLPATKQSNINKALASLEATNMPEVKVITDYVAALKRKDIAILGTDEAFTLVDKDGQIKAFKSALTLSQRDGTLIQPAPGGPFVLSAQGYEVWAEKTGTSVIFPKEVLVGNEWKPNPYAERDPNNRRILAVHARAVAFKYSSMGIPQVSDWTTIFDTPSYRMIDLLGKAKKFPQCFKVLPKGVKPPENKDETWASYPFDESMDLYINTSHNEVITWLSQILNREKKAMDFAQTFAKRNALKHLSGIQKAPANNWTIPVLAWRPTGNNVVKWDATQYAQLQDRVSSMISSGGGDEFQNQNQPQIELKTGAERTSEDESFNGMENAVDPEDSPEILHENEATPEMKPVNKVKPEPGPEPKREPVEISKEAKQAASLSQSFPDEYAEACKRLGVKNPDPSALTPEFATAICKKVSELLDSENQ